MIIDKGALGEKAKEMGFVRDTLEKVYRLTEILAFINEHTFLKDNLVLKGGTAINLTVFNLPRLSVDIDLDLAINYSREEMEKVRGKINGVIQGYMKINGYNLNPASKSRHSLDSWVYTYKNAGGNLDNIKIEINYSLRTHIYEPTKRPIVTSITDNELLISTLVPIELFAAKLNALMNRAAVRDLYDISNVIRYGLFDESQYDELRKCTIFYSAISAEVINKKFILDAIDEISFSKIKRDLFPVIANKEYFDLEQIKIEVKEFIRGLMILTGREKEFLDRFEKKEYCLELLFKDEKIVERLQGHPMALWKISRNGDM